MLTNFISRLKMAYTAFNSSKLNGIVKLENGLTLDLTNNRIIISGDFSLHATGNLKLSSSKHILINSGQTDEERPGYIHGIWMNTKVDDLGRPMLEKEDIIEAENYGSIKHN